MAVLNIVEVWCNGHEDLTSFKLPVYLYDAEPAYFPVMDFNSKNRVYFLFIPGLPIIISGLNFM